MIKSIALGSAGKCQTDITAEDAEIGAQIETATAFVVSNDSNKSFRPKSKKGLLSFQDLEDGQYDVFVTADKYKQSYFELDLNCGAGGKESVSLKVPIYKGFGDRSVLLKIADSGKLEKVQDVGNNVFVRGIGESVNNELIYKATPYYPASANANRVLGPSVLAIIFNEGGYVIFAEAISGHPALKKAAEEAAYLSRFEPTKVDGKRVKVSGKMLINFNL
ncbi:MAG: energy transducer TonB [Acidobacteria bacterium]|nr:energy transducer TonB [Acidobacteriota bacterium]